MRQSGSRSGATLARPVRLRGGTHVPVEDHVTVGCLALNSSFEPLTMVPLKRALRLVIDGKAEIVATALRSMQCLPCRTNLLAFGLPAMFFTALE